MLTQDLGRLNNAHGSIGGSRLRPDRRGREGDAFVACLFQGWVPCIAPVGSGRVGGSVFSLSWHLFVSVCVPSANWQGCPPVQSGNVPESVEEQLHLQSQRS